MDKYIHVYNGKLTPSVIGSACIHFLYFAGFFTFDFSSHDGTWGFLELWPAASRMYLGTRVSG